MDRKDLGTTLVVENETGTLLGILTDGDLRRLLQRRLSLAGLLTRQAMTPRPKVLSPLALASEALNLMEAHLITVLPIVDDDGRIRGILHLHDLLGRGEFKFR
jgi:arabinose-5-phosphate isomerase